MSSTAPPSLHHLGPGLDSSAVSTFDASSTSHSADSSPRDSAGLIPGLSMAGRPTSKKRSHASSAASSSTPADGGDTAELALKRQRNNVAAKKYRQKRIDRIEELEGEVDAVKKERDELRIRLARQEAETAALREMLKLGVPK